MQLDTYFSDTYFFVLIFMLSYFIHRSCYYLQDNLFLHFQDRLHRQLQKAEEIRNKFHAKAKFYEKFIEKSDLKKNAAEKLKQKRIKVIFQSISIDSDFWLILKSILISINLNCLRVRMSAKLYEKFMNLRMWNSFKLLIL